MTIKPGIRTDTLQFLIDQLTTLCLAHFFNLDNVSVPASGKSNTGLFVLRRHKDGSVRAVRNIASEVIFGGIMTSIFGFSRHIMSGVEETSVSSALSRIMSHLH